MDMINLAPALQEQDQLRADIYALLASLLRSSPNQELINWLKALEINPQEASPMAAAWSSLALAAKHAEGMNLEDEHQDLFIGIGRGELMPFGSWYLTGSLMEKPLAFLRQDLKQLGYERQEETFEPEDHIAALCEVMSLMITNNHGYQQQHTFWKRHLEPWALRFFKDLQHAKRAIFYSPVGLLGESFMKQESNYFLQLSPADFTSKNAGNNNNQGATL